MAKETMHFSTLFLQLTKHKPIESEGKIEHESLIISNQIAISIKCYYRQATPNQLRNSITLAKRVRHMFVAKDNNTAFHQQTWQRFKG